MGGSERSLTPQSLTCLKAEMERASSPTAGPPVYGLLHVRRYSPLTRRRLWGSSTSHRRLWVWSVSQIPDGWGEGGVVDERDPRRSAAQHPVCAQTDSSLAMRYGWTIGSTPGHKAPGHKAPSAAGNARAPFLLSAGFPTGFFLSKSCRRP